MPKSIFRIFTKKVFIIANLATVLLFLLGCYNGYVFSEQWWLMGFLALSAFYLFLLLCLFALFWLLFRSKWALLLPLSIGLAWSPLQHIVPWRMNTSFQMEKTSDKLRVMSWNVAQFDILYYKKSHKVFDSMIALVNQYQPDIACFQEMVASDSNVNIHEGYMKHYYSKFSYYPLSSFDSSLHFPNHFYGYNWKENFLEGQHFGVIIFSKYPIIHQDTIGISPFDYNSIFQYADIVKEKDTFRVFNLHLQSLKFSPTNLEYIDHPSIDNKTSVQRSKNVISKFRAGFKRRKLQADRIHQAILESPYPVIVCGDFNDVPNSYAYSIIGNDLQNAFAEKGSGLGRTFSGIAPTLRIDNIFVDLKYRIDQFVTVKRKLSDHFPIVTDLTLHP